MEHSVTGGAATALSSLAVDPQERERIDAICTWVRRQGEAPGAVDQIAARLAAGDPATSIGELQLADLTVQHTVHLLSQARQKFASTPGITSDGRAKRDRAINALKNAIETMAPEAVLAVFKQPTQLPGLVGPAAPPVAMELDNAPKAVGMEVADSGELEDAKPSAATIDFDDPVEANRALIHGTELYARIINAKLLVVGAGGIGCELLKDLVLTGFRRIEIIDLDHIDVSNLNRQFLFRARHVGQSKAQVAREMALGFNPRAEIVAHHNNIKAEQYGLDFFRGFDLVLNALDNIDARRHVNRMCLATGRPMIDAGTTGYIGQVTVMKKDEVACYECEPKATAKVYPICTIRSTPDKPVHCVVWAKEAFKLIFGQPDSSMLYEAPDAPEPSLFMPAVNDKPARGDRAGVLRYGWSVLEALFVRDMSAKIDKGVYAKAQKPPEPLTQLLPPGDEGWQTALDRSAVEGRLLSAEQEAAAGRRGGEWQRQVLEVEECVEEVLGCLLANYCDADRSAHLGSFDFDKDDGVAMRFVAAMTNLRSRVFGISLETLHSAKGIAGNIIPAIATTNAMAAGLQVLEALKILRAGPGATVTEAGCSTTYISRAQAGRKGLLLQPTALTPQVSRCYVCSKGGADLEVDTSSFTLQELIDKVLKAKLAFNSPTILLKGGDIIHEEGQGADESLAVNLPKTLASLPAGGIRDQTTVEVDDAVQDLQLQLRVRHRHANSFNPEEAPEGFVLSIGTASPATAEASMAQADEQQAEGQDAGGGKRPRQETEGPMEGQTGGTAEVKRPRVGNVGEEDEGDVIVMDEA